MPAIIAKKPERDAFITKVIEYYQGCDGGTKNVLSLLFSRTEDELVSFDTVKKEFDDYVEFSHDATKCYEPWDSIVNTIFTLSEDAEVEVAYVRLGTSSLGDIEQHFTDGEFQYPVEVKLCPLMGVK